MQAIRSGSPLGGVNGPGPFAELFWDQIAVFYKTRMRRLLRRIIADAVPDGLRLDRRAVVGRALALERAARARGLMWNGLCPAQAALVIVLGVRGLSGGPGAADAARLEAAAGRFATRRGLGGFACGIAGDMARIERRATAWPSAPRLFGVV